MIELDTGRARQIAIVLYDVWNSTGILGDHTMPESQVPAGMKRGSSEHALFLTLTVAIDYMRDADQLWSAARATFNDPKTRYLFDPSQVAQTPAPRVQRDLSKHQVLKKRDRDTQIWTTLCRTLSRDFQGKVEAVLARANWDAPRALALIQSPPYGRGFPNLKGPKIAPLWIRMLADEWQAHPIHRLAEVPLPVDIHTGAATVMLGCVRGTYRGTMAPFRAAVQQVWREGCAGTERYPLQLDEPLWHLSRNGCRKTTTMPCTFRADCDFASFCTETRLVISAQGAEGPEEVGFEIGRW